MQEASCRRVPFWSALCAAVIVLFAASSASAQVDFLEAVATEADFESVSVPGREGSIVQRATKYTLPARADETLLQTVYQNVNRFQLHQEFLGAVFPDKFPGLDVATYIALTERRETRDYYVGVLSKLSTEAGETVYGFSVIVDTTSEEELLSVDEIEYVFNTLKETFSLEPLVYYPESTRARQAAMAFVDPPFSVFLEEDTTITFQAYTRAVGYGVVRILDPQEFEIANETGQMSFQSILVLEEAPRDIEGVLGGVITAQEQGELSHVAIRTARRNTPNAFVRNATEAFAEWEDKLVRLEVTATEYTVAEVMDPAEAEAFWAQNRPVLSQLPTLDTDWTELSSLAEIAAMDVDDPQEDRFGGKATNLGRLGRVLTDSPFDQFVEVGFGIPVHYYFEFMRSNKIQSVVNPQMEVTYEEYLRELFEQDLFKTDSTARFRALDDFRDFARDNGVVPTELVDRLTARVEEIFPFAAEGPNRIRFRSSSNVEDALEFNGAGLYESTAVCLADMRDLDNDGPSRCNPEAGGERGILRALKKVWTSVYTFRAFEERAFYGIPEDLVGMGILASRAFPDELANGVAFTGNFSNPLDRRYVITAQVGDVSVVHPDPNIRAEKNILEIENGEVTSILRPRFGSSLVDPGVWVVPDDHLREMGAVMAYVEANLPVDLGDYRREEVLLDLEFKIEPDNSLAFKQVRPFLLTDVPEATPTFELEIPAGLEICGTFATAGDRRGPQEELELKSTVRMRGGTTLLPTNQDSFSAEIFEEVRFGPDAEVAQSAAPGQFRVLTLPAGGGETVYRFTYDKTYTLSDGSELLLQIVSPLSFRGSEGQSVDGPIVLDEAFFTVLSGRESIQGTLDGTPLVRYGSCSYSLLPPVVVEAGFADGTSLTLLERYQEAESLFDTAPAAIHRADLTMGAEERTVTDYYELVYSASRHNTSVHYWVVVDPPVTLDGVGEVHVIELAAPEPLENAGPRARYLGADYQELASVDVTSFERTAGEADPSFQRGDAGADGGLDVTDALRTLNFLFAGGTLSCTKSADTNDDGRLNLLDAIGVVGILFRGADAPEPFLACGVDGTSDSLTCDSYPPCE